MKLEVVLWSLLETLMGFLIAHLRNFWVTGILSSEKNKIRMEQKEIQLSYVGSRRLGGITVTQRLF